MPTPSAGDSLLNRYTVVDEIAVAGQAVLVRCVDERATGSTEWQSRSWVRIREPKLPQEFARAQRCATVRTPGCRRSDRFGNGRRSILSSSRMSRAPTSRVIAEHGSLTPRPGHRDPARRDGGLDAIHNRVVTGTSSRRTSSSAADELRIIDLGIARVIHEPTLTTGSGLLGTPGTMARSSSMTRARWIGARTSIRWAPCSTECSRANPPSRSPREQTPGSRPGRGSCRRLHTKAPRFNRTGPTVPQDAHRRRQHGTRHQGSNHTALKPIAQRLGVKGRRRRVSTSPRPR